MSDSIREELQSIMEEQLPHIDDSTFSAGDRDHVDTISLMLGNLNSAINSLVADIELFDYAESHADVMMRWSAIACRDAAMSIGHFQEALGHLERAVSQCKPLKSKTRERSLRSVIGRTNAAFPEKIRHTTAHAAGHIGTPQARKRNTIFGAPVIIHNSRIGRTVTHSVENGQVSFDMSGATVETLRQLRNDTFALFR
jgi:hypothetical protein